MLRNRCQAIQVNTPDQLQFAIKNAQYDLICLWVDYDSKAGHALTSILDNDPVAFTTPIILIAPSTIDIARGDIANKGKLIFDVLRVPINSEQFLIRIDAGFRYAESLFLRERQSGAIILEFEFPPEYRDAAASLLTYFKRVTNVKFPDIDVRVIVEQSGPIVKLTVWPPSDKSADVSTALQQYRQVISGEMPVNEFLNSKAEIMALKKELDDAKKRIEDMVDKNERKDLERINFTENIASQALVLARCISSESGGTMAIFNQPNHQVQNQNNAAGKLTIEGGIHINGTLTTIDAVRGLRTAAQQIPEEQRAVVLQSVDIIADKAAGIAVEEDSLMAAIKRLLKIKLTHDHLEKIATSVPASLATTALIEAVKLALKLYV
jgi:regulator of replication initiation timing